MLEVHPDRLVFGLPVHILKDYKGWLKQRLEEQVGTHVVTLNSEMAMQAEKNADLGKTIREAELVIPDGAGVVLHFLIRGERIRRIPGIELARDVLRLAADIGRERGVFLIGGEPGVAEIAAKSWQERLPNLAIAGIHHGYLNPENSEPLRQTLKDSQPAVILVGMGVPRQEFWIAENRQLCPNAIWIGVGGSFDIWAGRKTRAPLWLQRLYLEWAYRLYQEPWRWRRMASLPQFAWRSLTTAIVVRR
ncbi:MAG: WecB/TagA/CpsF family glycosyltransferase [Oscillatoria sp. SIO1A7]|nr:WecB/TagA/CpsF family glycosyltransferase [Oscillatoria sp. SIO1A7]